MLFKSTKWLASTEKHAETWQYCSCLFASILLLVEIFEVNSLSIGCQTHYAQTVWRRDVTISEWNGRSPQQMDEVEWSDTTCNLRCRPLAPIICSSIVHIVCREITLQVLYLTCGNGVYILQYWYCAVTMVIVWLLFGSRTILCTIYAKFCMTCLQLHALLTFGNHSFLWSVWCLCSLEGGCLGKRLSCFSSTRSTSTSYYQWMALEEKYQVPSSGISTVPWIPRKLSRCPVDWKASRTRSKTGNTASGGTSSSTSRIWFAHGLCSSPNSASALCWPLNPFNMFWWARKEGLCVKKTEKAPNKMSSIE